VRWCVLSEASPPSSAQCFDVETTQARDLGFDGRFCNNPGSRHGGQDLRPSDFVSMDVAPYSSMI